MFRQTIFAGGQLTHYTQLLLKQEKGNYLITTIVTPLTTLKTKTVKQYYSDIQLIYTSPKLQQLRLHVCINRSEVLVLLVLHYFIIGFCCYLPTFYFPHLRVSVRLSQTQLLTMIAAILVHQSNRCTPVCILYIFMCTYTTTIE